MLQRKSKVGTIDNSLIKQAEIHHVYNKSGIASVGDIVRLSVKERYTGCKYKKGDVIKGLVVRTVRPVKRDFGMMVSFSSNDIIVINNNYAMSHSRILGPIFREYNRNRKFPDIDKNSKEII